MLLVHTDTAPEQDPWNFYVNFWKPVCTHDIS